MDLDLLVIGAGPTGIAVGAEARRVGLDVLLVDRGQLTQALLDFPTFMTFFTTRDKLEIAGVPLCIPDEKPSRQQALVYYRAVVAHHQIPLALNERVLSAARDGEAFVVETESGGTRQQRRARAVVIATGYFDQPFKLTIPGADAPWIKSYYDDPYRHFGERVVLIGGGNSACEAALDLWRNGAGRVTMLVRGPRLREGVKYWVRPDVENRIAENSIDAHFNATVEGFEERPRRVRFRDANGALQTLEADAVFALLWLSSGRRPPAALWG